MTKRLMKTSTEMPMPGIADVPFTATAPRNRAVQPGNSTAPRKCADLGAYCACGARACSLFV
jgi:hypothetical protein